MTEQPRTLARIAGVFYLLIFPFALWGYLYVRGQLIVPGNMAQTAANILEHERLFRMVVPAAVIVVMCNLLVGLLFYELFKVVNRRVAGLALLFIIGSATLEAANVLNHYQTLVPLTLPEYVSAFGPEQRQALARGAVRMFGVGFSVSLCLFGVFCMLTGYLIFKSRFLPAWLGVLMAAGGVVYNVNSLVLFLGLPDSLHIPWVTLVAELSLTLWLLIKGVDEAKWFERAGVQFAADEPGRPHPRRG